jgi:drug/metabolite transporter (DMT)-like permease
MRSGMHLRTRKLALTEGAVAGVLFGTAAIFIRFLQDVDAFSLVFWRLIIACLALGIVLLVIRKSFNLSLIRNNLKDLLILSVFLGLHFIFFVSAVKNTTILNATVLVNTTPLFSVFISSFVFKLKPSRFQVFGLVISFLGICVIAFAETAVAGAVVHQEGSSPNLLGDLEAVFAAFVESFYLSYGSRIRSKMNIIPIMFPIYFFTALFVGALSLPVTGKILSLPTRTSMIILLVGLGILPTAAAHTLYFSSLSNLKSFETATMALLEPVGATILGIALFQEIPDEWFVVGAALVLAGIFFIVKNKNGNSTQRIAARDSERSG